MLIFVADHISIPADARRIDLPIKSATSAFEPWAAIAPSSNWGAWKGEAVRWIQEYCVTREVKIEPDAARGWWIRWAAT